MSKLRVPGIFLILFLYLSAWALIKPPFQSPDEFSHLLRAHGIPENPWVADNENITVSSPFYNTLTFEPRFRSIPFHPHIKLSHSDLARYKTYEWLGDDSWETRKFLVPSFSYPTFFYASVFALGESLTSIFDLTPYQSFYAYRVATAFLTALLLVFLFQALGLIPSLVPYRGALIAVITLNPMFGFISSSINPDAFLNPLVALAMVYSYLSFTGKGHTIAALSTLVLSAFTKPSALVLFPTLGIMAAIVFLLSNKKLMVVRNSLAVVIGGFAIAYFSFYLRSFPKLYGVPMQKTLEAYVLDWSNRLSGFFIMYWGKLGWLDYKIDSFYYDIIAALIVLNALVVLITIKNWRKTPFTFYSTTLALVFIFGTIAGEFYYLSQAGYTLQGRYFFPVSLGLSMFIVHPLHLLRWITIAYLAVFNGLLFNQTVFRYYDGEWMRAWHALPFTTVSAENLKRTAKAIQPPIEFSAVTDMGSIDQVIATGLVLTIEGWAKDRAHTSSHSVTVVTDSKPYDVQLSETTRSDVVEALRDDTMLTSGFRIALFFHSKEELEAAKNSFCVFIEAPDLKQPAFVPFPDGARHCKRFLKEE